MEIPVYLFTGFLDSGKTKFIQETLEDVNFNNGEKILLVVCEEGEEEYNEDNICTALSDVGTSRHIVKVNPASVLVFNNSFGS